MIRDGRVTVNGRTARIGDKADPDRDDVRLDGQPVIPFLDHIYVALNKPAGYLSTRKDTHGRLTVMDLVSDPLLYPVGRLDKETSGLLLLTNDGDFAYRMTHPSHEVEKTYLARVKGRISNKELADLRRGVELEDGPAAPAKTRLISLEADASLVEIVIREGRKRQVRRMLLAVGHPVLELCRTAIDGLSLEGIKTGSWRELTVEEVLRLRQAAETER